MSKLPIDVVSRGAPLVFEWQHRVDTVVGARVQECRGALPASVEGAVSDLIKMVKALQRECADLRKKLAAAQAPATPAPAPQPAKKR